MAVGITGLVVITMAVEMVMVMVMLLTMTLEMLMVMVIVKGRVLVMMIMIMAVVMVLVLLMAMVLLMDLKQKSSFRQHVLWKYTFIHQNILPPAPSYPSTPRGKHFIDELLQLVARYGNKTATMHLLFIQERLSLKLSTLFS